MLRGEVAKRSGVHPETIRYYEKIKLLPEPIRGSSGYREYPPTILQQLQFIQSAKKLGFSLNEIQALLSLKNTKDHPCQNVKEKALEKLHEIEEKLQELHSMHDELSRIVVRCDGQHPSESCAIIHALEATETSTTKS